MYLGESRPVKAGNPRLDGASLTRKGSDQIAKPGARRYEYEHNDQT